MTVAGITLEVVGWLLVVMGIGHNGNNPQAAGMGRREDR
jgi:hypothetical protein